MYVEQKQVEPVTITLETQDEVDRLYALLVHSNVSENLLHGWWSKLESYRSLSYRGYFEVVENEIVK